jgi:hypothetical protein
LSGEKIRFLSNLTFPEIPLFDRTLNLPLPSFEGRFKRFASQLAVSLWIPYLESDRVNSAFQRISAEEADGR